MEKSDFNDHDYVTIQEGIFQGVAYRINSCSVDEKPDSNGSYVMKFDYDVHGLDAGNEQEFEYFLGDYLTRAISEYSKIKTDMES